MAETKTTNSKGAASKAKPAAKKAPRGPIEKRVAELRAQAKTDPAGAQRDTWAWFEELGAKRDGKSLQKLFSLGTPPRGLNGPTDGILVCTLTNPVLDLPVQALTSRWMPWQGKAFDAKAKTGINRMTKSSKVPLKAIFPLYSMRETPDGNLAFDFETAAEAGKVAPKIKVLKIDYQPVKDNPDHIIRQIRDELVQIVPDTHLGRILFNLPVKGFVNIGYFALRQPAG
jgi:hypothetical protein